jgi:undecaprenyl diphosphate synthase
MDGNRRWAAARGLPKMEGHRVGYDALGTIAQYALDRGIKYLTVFAFSTENWGRAPEEVSYLMVLIERGVNEWLRKAVEKGARLRFLGRIKDFSPKIQDLIAKAEQKTAGNVRGNLNIALGYGGHAEMADAAAATVAAGEQLTEKSIRGHLYAPDVPDLDLLIRTSGEYRLSGFMLWRAAYAELYFTPTTWPDFTPAHFDEALAEYARRERRMGK